MSDVITNITAEAEVKQYTLVGDDTVTGIIYKCTNIKNGKCYIGQTIKSVEVRISQHCKRSSNGSMTPFHCAIRKYGIESFMIEELVVNVPCSILDDLEINVIHAYDALSKGYNATVGGDGTRGHKHSAAVRERIRVGNLGKRNTQESIERMRIAQKGKIISENTKEKLRRVNLGKKHTEVTKRKLSAAYFNHDRAPQHALAKKASARQVLCVDTGVIFPSVTDASIAVCGGKGQYSSIICVCNGTRRTAAKFKWEYINE